jgi:DNA-binding MarR family transcriptional regulator
MATDGIDELRQARPMQRMLGSRRARPASPRPRHQLSQQATQVLRVLSAGEPHPVADVARRARMDVGAVSRQLRALESAGFAEREASPDHGSVVLVRATPEGVAAMQRVELVRRRHLHDALAG